MLMSQYIASLERLRQEYLREDAQTQFSDKAFAQRLLSRAGLTKKARMDCFFSAGGKYKAKDIERLLRFRCAKVHEEESRRPAAPRANEESSASRSSGYKRSNRSGRYQYRGSTRYGRQVYHADDSQAYDDDDQETGDADDEDLEEEMASGRIKDEDDYQDSWQDDYGGYGQDSYWQADGDWMKMMMRMSHPPRRRTSPRHTLQDGAPKPKHRATSSLGPTDQKGLDRVEFEALTAVRWMTARNSRSVPAAAIKGIGRVTLNTPKGCCRRGSRWRQ